jgi:hypothetical protein
MLGIQILSVLFILFMMYVVRIHYKKGELPKVEAMSWLLSLFALGIIVAVESSANFLRRIFEVNRLTDVIVIFAFMGSYALLIENRIQINKLRQKLEKVVRDKAIKQADSK